MAEITVRVAKSQQDAAAIHAFMLGNAVPEMAEAKVDGRIYMETIWHTVQHGVALMAIEGERIVGYLGIAKSRFCYSPEHFLHDDGFWILPEHRNGAASRELLGKAREIAQAAGLILKIIDTRPTKHRGKRGLAITAEIIGFRPEGRVFTFYPNVRTE